MIRYAVIGTSWITDAFIEGAAQSTPELVLSAVYSRTCEKGMAFAARHGISTVYTSLQQLAQASDIDAVYIASPNIMHYPQARMMLSAGKHVLCEKTCVVTSAQLEDLLGIAADRGAVLMEAIKILHMPELKTVEEALPRLGRVHLCKFDFSRYSSKYPQYLAGQTPNIFKPELAAGALMDMGIYSVYPAVWLFGEPLRVQAHAVLLRTGADGAGGVLLDYDDNVVSITYSKMSESRQWCTIQGDQGVLAIDTIEHMDCVDFIDCRGVREPLLRRDTARKPMGFEANGFYRWITDPAGCAEESARVTDTTRAVIRTMERIRASAGIRLPALPESMD